MVKTAGFSCSARRELVFDRGPRECRTLQNTLQRRNSNGGAVFWLRLDQERKKQQEIKENIREEVESMVSDRKEPTEVKYKRQIQLELSSLQSISGESSIPSEDEDEAHALMSIARKLEQYQAEKQEFELKYLPGEEMPSALLSIASLDSMLLRFCPNKPMPYLHF